MIAQNQIYGCLLGCALADAAGAVFEGTEQSELRQRFSGPREAFDHALVGNLRFTDDTQMMLAVADYLAGHESICYLELMDAFVEAYEPWRGYGRGTRTLVDAYRDQIEYEFLAQTIFPGGSHGNGGAMRSAPVGLKFFKDDEVLWSEAKQSAWPTHRHVLGVEGTQLIAYATALAVCMPEISPELLARKLLGQCQTQVFETRLLKLQSLTSEDGVSEFGNGIEAHESVVTALACFALNSTDYEAAVSLAIWQGGDTDTIAAMTGALVGAHAGDEAIPTEPLLRLEDGQPFLDRIRETATDLWRSQNAP